MQVITLLSHYYSHSSSVAVGPPSVLPYEVREFCKKNTYRLHGFLCGTKSQALRSIFSTERKEISRSSAASRVYSVGATSVQV